MRLFKSLHYAPIPKAVFTICQNWDYYNRPYKAEEEKKAEEAALLNLQDKQKYLQSLDHPENSK